LIALSSSFHHSHILASTLVARQNCSCLKEIVFVLILKASVGKNPKVKKIHLFMRQMSVFTSVLRDQQQ
jgi:hypothetical protein